MMSSPFLMKMMAFLVEHMVTIIYCSKNFDLKNNAIIQLSDVFMDINKIDWNKILMNNFKNPDQKEMLLVDKIPGK